MRRILLAAPHPVIGIPVSAGAAIIGWFSLEHGKGSHQAGTWALVLGIAGLVVYILRAILRP
jgi:hypothetical protein